MTQPSTTLVGAEIRRARKSLLLSQIALGRKVGLAWSTMSEYERGDLIPSLTRCRQLDVALTLPAGTLESLARQDVAARAVARWEKEEPR